MRFFRLHLIFIAMGAAAMAAQILVMRRLIVLFGGNELTAGAIFAAWMGFSGVGNLIAGRFADRLRDPVRAAAAALFALALATPATVALSGLAKAVAGIPPPEITGLPFVILATLVLLAPMGLLIGLSFTIACRLPASGTASDIGRVYLLDLIGAGIGGLLLSTYAIAIFTSLQTALIVAAVLAAAVGWAFARPGIKMASFGVVALLALAIWFAPTVDGMIARVQWSGFNPIVQRESLFSNLMVTENQGERTLFIDGRPAFSLPLPETYEAKAWVGRLEHPAAEKIAIIGGGISGILSQWRLHPPERAYFLRLDPMVTELERTAMPSAFEPWPEWAEIITGDERRSVREGISNASHHEGLDLLIVDVGDPETAATDRFYTREFFEESARILQPDGVMMLALMQPSNVVSEESAALLGSVTRTLGTVFAHVVVLPLDRYYFFASQEAGALTDDAALLMQRATEMAIDAPTLTVWMLPSIAPERVTSVREAVDAAAHIAPINTDRRPIAYRAAMMMWETRAGSWGRRFVAATELLRPWMGASLSLLMAGICVLLGRRHPNAAERIRATWLLYAVGFSAMSFEIALIVFYQMQQGLLVAQIGFILTAFMVGAGAGALIAMGWLRGRRASLWLLVGSPVLMAGYMLLLFLVTRVNFILANALAGMLTGWIYQLAASRLAGRRHGIGTTAAIVESSDHWGAAVGALITTLITLPLFGITATLATASFTLILAALTIAALPRT